MRSIIAATLLAVFVSPVSSQILITTDEMSQSLERDLEEQDGKAVRFRMSNGGGQASPCPPPPIEAIKREDLLIFDCLAIMKNAGKKFRSEQKYVQAGGELAVFVGRTDIDTWDGAQSRSGTFNEDGTGRAGSIDRAPGMNLYMEGQFTWLGWWVLQYKGGWTFPELLRKPECEAPKLLKDGSTQWSWKASPTQEFTFIAHWVEGRPRLRRVEVRVYFDHDGQRTLGMSAITTWGDTWEHGLAKSAHTVWEMMPRDANPWWGSCSLELISVESAEIRDDTFKLAFQPGMGIADTRYRIGYVLGESELNLDGRLLQTAKPMEGDVGDNLEQWVKEGEFVTPEESGGNEEQ